MNIYALWDEVLSLEDLKNIQYLTYWVQSEVAKVKNSKMFNLKKNIPEDQTMKVKNALTMITETCNINHSRVISEYNNKQFSKLIKKRRRVLNKRTVFYKSNFKDTSSVIFIRTRFSR